MDLETQTAKALEASILKWEALSVTDDCTVSIYSDTCALCTLFQPEGHDEDENHKPCVGCPVSEKTGEVFCCNTPWSEASRALGTWQEGPFNDHTRNQARFRRAAVKMTDFLKGLRHGSR